MASPEQRDAYKRVVNLILEEIEGCELEPSATATIELMNVVREMQDRLTEGLSPRPLHASPQRQAVKSDRKYHPKPKATKKWQRGPLAATTATVARPMPPWFSGG
jgi:hypothetical protein